MVMKAKILSWSMVTKQSSYYLDFIASPVSTERFLVSNLSIKETNSILRRELVHEKNIFHKKMLKRNF